MAELTLVMSVFGQPMMLEKQFQTIAGYSPTVRERLRVVVVDDHGDPPVDCPAIEELDEVCLSASLLRVDDDIPWNQPGGRNLGMHHSQGWCLMIDPDMVFDSDTMGRLMEAAGKLPRGHLAKYALRHVGNGQLDVSSPNTYLIHRDDFFKAGGYDEDFAGNKGWSDVQLLDILNAHFKIHKRPDLFADFYSTREIPDAAVTTLDRSTAANRKKRLKKVAQARAVGGWVRWVRDKKKENLRFKWHQIYPPS